MTIKRIIITLLLTYFALNSFSQLNTKNVLNIGKNAIFFDDYISAIQNFNSIIKVKPYLEEPYFFRGLAKYNLEDFIGSDNDYTKSLQINPNYTFAYIYRGVTRHQLKMFQKALNDFNKALKLNPGNAIIYANRGLTKAALEQYIEAEKDYTIAIKLDPKLIGSYINRAAVRSKLNNIKGAIEDCNRAISLNIFNADAYNNRGILYYGQKKFKEAIEDFNKAIKINPKNTGLYINRAITKYQLKDLKGTLMDYNKVISIDPNNAIAYYNRAILKVEIGDINSAIEDYGKVIEMNPDNILVYYNRAYAKSLINNIDGAINDYSQAIDLYKNFAHAYFARANLYYKKGEEQKAMFDQQRGNTILERNKKLKTKEDIIAYADTTKNFRKMMDLNSRTGQDSVVIKGRVQNKKIDIKLEENFTLRFVPLDSLKTGRLSNYNQAVFKLNKENGYNPAYVISNTNLEVSKNLIDDFIIKNKDSKDSRMLYNVGLFYSYKNKYNEAISYIKKSIELSSNSSITYFSLGNIIASMNEYIAKLTKQNSTTNQNSIIDYSEVIKMYDKSINLNSNFAYVYFNKANVLAKSRKFKEALSFYTLAISKEPDCAEAYYNRGLIYIFLNQTEKAYLDLSKSGELGLTGAYNVIKRYCN